MNASVHNPPCSESSFRSHVGNMGSVFQIVGTNHARKHRKQNIAALHVGMNAKVSVSSAFGFDLGDEELRKFITEKEGKEPRITVGFNLLESYRAVCNRVEQAAESEVRLKGEIDAVIASFGEVADSADRTTLRGKKTAKADSD